MARTLAVPEVGVAWTGLQTGVFRLDVSLLDGSDVLSGTFGNLVYDDLTTVVKSAHITRGQQGEIGAFEQGRIELLLKDVDGTYNPLNPDSPLAGYLDTHKMLRFRETHSDYATTVGNDAPLGFWRLGERSGTSAADASGNTRTGTYTGGYTLAQTGALAGDADPAVLFNGSTGYVTVADDTALRFTTAFTIELWMKAASTTGGGQYLLTKDDRYGVIYEFTNNTVEFFAAGYTGSDPRTGSGITVADTNWHHIVYTYDGVTLRGYKDGAQAIAVTTTFTLGTNSGALTFGGYPAHQFFNGTLDEVAVSSAVLSAARILAHYQAGVGTGGDSASYGLFLGFTSKIEHRPHLTERETLIEAVDFSEWLNAARPTIAATGPTTVGAVIGLILDSLEWTDVSLRSLDAGSSIPDFAADGTQTALQLIDELLEIDLGYFFIDGDGVVTYQSRDTRWGAAGVVDAFGDTTVSEARPSVDKQAIINRQTVTREGGTPQTAADTDGKPYYDGTPIESAYLASDIDALALAQFIVALRKGGIAPTRSVVVWNRDDASITRQLRRELGDRVLFTESLGGSDTEATIEGIAHEIGSGGKVHRTSYLLRKREISGFTLDVSALDGADVLAY